MNRVVLLPIVSLVALASVVGCALTDEGTAVSEGALDGLTNAGDGGAPGASDEASRVNAPSTSPRITEAELASKAEAHFAELEAADPAHPGQAKSTVLFAVDDEAPVTVEEAALDKQLAPIPLNAFTPAPQLELQTHTSPVFYLRGSNAATVGSFECASIPGAAAVLVKIPSPGVTDRYLPRPGDACTISIAKVYPEDFGSLAAYASSVHLKPRTIVVGSVSATLHNDAGVAVDVRAAFVLPVITR